MSQEQVSSTQGARNELIRVAVDKLRNGKNVTSLIEERLEKLNLGDLNHSPHFASFSEYIDYVLASLYSELVYEHIAGRLLKSMESKTRSDFRKELSEILSTPFGKSQSLSASALNTIATLAFSRPSLIPVLSTEQLKLVIHISKIIRMAQIRGWIRTDIDPNQLSSFILTYSFGQILQEVSTIENFRLNQENLINGIINNYFLTS